MMPHQKPKTPRDKKYLEFIRSKPCCISGQPAEAHHESGLGDSGGMSLKCSDYFTVPLARGYHDERDRLGVYSFWDKYNLDVKRLIIDYLSEYIQNCIAPSISNWKRRVE